MAGTFYLQFHISSVKNACTILQAFFYADLNQHKKFRPAGEVAEGI